MQAGKMGYLYKLYCLGWRNSSLRAIEWHLRLLAQYLLYKDETRLPWGRIGGKDQADPTVAAVGAIALAYARNRICAPRDMSAGAATAFRAATDKVLTLLY